MAWVTLVAWVVTALGGTVLGALWARHEGPKQSEGIRWPRLGAHVALAVAGLAFWVVFAAGGSETFAWIALGLLVTVMVVGFSMVALWLRGRSSQDDLTWLPAEASFPVPLVAGHGILALLTLLLGILAVVGV